MEKTFVHKNPLVMTSSDQMVVMKEYYVGRDIIWIAKALKSKTNVMCSNILTQKGYYKKYF